MTPRHIIASLLALLLALAASAAMAGRSDEATVKFDQGDYKGAYKSYLKQAKKGDSFSQYRVSYMSLMGLGTKEDVIESLAWAVLAAEQGGQELARYQDAVASLVPESSRKKAQAKVDYYARRWGKEESGNGPGTLARSSEGSCTGSRLAANCGQGGSGSGKWIAWGTDRSGEPGRREHIEELNRSILDRELGTGNENSGS